MRCIEQYSARKTYPQLLPHLLRLIVEYPTGPIFSIGGGSIVVERVGQPHHSGVLNQAKEVFPAQKTEDPIDFECVGPSTQHFGPVSARVIKKNN